MKKGEFTLLEQVNDYCGNLAEVHPSLLHFAHEQSELDLAQLTSHLHSETLSGRPVRPPSEFLLAVRQVVSQKEWTQLYGLLEKWNQWSCSAGETGLNGEELEILTLGLLWETSLMIECERRLPSGCAALTGL